MNKSDNNIPPLTQAMRAKGQEALKAAESLTNMPYSMEQIEKQTAESFRIHGQRNPNN